VTGPEADAAARLLERLLTDPVLRTRFRRDPVGASREAGVESLAQEMTQAAGKAMETLDGRESRSSLAGVFMAAALEGVAGYDLIHDALPSLEAVPDAVGQVLSRVDLPAIPGLQVATAQAAPPSNAAGKFRAVLPEVRTGREGDRIDPDQFGQEGTGGPAPAEDVALLHNKRVTLDASGIADLKSGKIDPRVASVLAAISRDHKVTVSAVMSDHDKNTSGGSISNHYYGRAIDIASVDGQPVGPGNQAAREVAIALSRLDPGIRPSEIGSPWALPGPAYFTDAAHQNHLHVAFDDPIAPGWTPPDDLEAGGTPQDFPDDLPQDFPDQTAPDAGDGADAGEESDDEGADEPGGLEDPGGDTDEEADAESDGGDDAEDDEDGADEESDDESDDEEEDGEDEGADGDHDDSSDSDGGDSDGSGSGAGGDAGEVGDSGAPLDLGDTAGGYPGDHASQAQIAAWMGAEAQKRGLPPELPVMAALVESNLRNLNHGDADSVGFFQMRLSIWNQGDYAGYPDSPERQLDWFLDHAAALKRQGQGTDDPSGFGEWVANVERPAEQYRGRYQLRLAEARSLLREGSDQGGVLEQVAGSNGRSAGPRALAALAEAKKYKGTPYQWGGSTPKTGFDCSGLVQWAYAKAGIKIPRVTDQQFDAPGGSPVSRRNVRPGDLVFFRDSSGYIHHVGISLGGDKFLHAPHTGDVVKTSSLNESYYAQQFAGGRRFDQARAGSARAAVAAVAPADPPRVDPDAAREAEAAVARDAAEVQRAGTLLWQAVRAQEERKANADAGFHRAVRPGR
jgi:NlpC/P60 family